MTEVDLGFTIRGTTVPIDHGYALYSAICRAVSTLHKADWLGVHPLSGSRLDEETLSLRKQARLLMRLPAERIPEVLPLAGATLDVGGSKIVLGTPSVSALVPAACLDARIVHIKLTNAPRRTGTSVDGCALDVAAFAERYKVELRRQLGELGIGAEPQLCGRRRITVGGKRLIGYSVRVDALSADQSVALQTRGLGGKRRMGCGIFRPTRGA
jgi:CRISPR-associated protein Cas6